jgi:hypothetical protein
MLTRNVNVSALNPSFQMLPKVLHSVDVSVAANVFTGPVIDRVVSVSFSGKPVVGFQFVGVNLSAR